jgi:hypothetical protein
MDEEEANQLVAEIRSHVGWSAQSVPGWTAGSPRHWFYVRCYRALDDLRDARGVYHDYHVLRSRAMWLLLLRATGLIDQEGGGTTP